MDNPAAVVPENQSLLLIQENRRIMWEYLSPTNFLSVFANSFILVLCFKSAELKEQNHSKYFIANTAFLDMAYSLVQFLFGIIYLYSQLLLYRTRPYTGIRAYWTRLYTEIRAYRTRPYRNSRTYRIEKFRVPRRNSSQNILYIVRVFGYTGFLGIPDTQNLRSQPPVRCKSNSDCFEAFSLWKSRR